MISLYIEFSLSDSAGAENSGGAAGAENSGGAEDSVGVATAEHSGGAAGAEEQIPGPSNTCKTSKLIN